MSEVVELSPMARIFALEYLKDFKAGPAALRAGYASAQSGYWLKIDPRIDALIREGMRRASDRIEISVDKVLETYRAMVDVSIADYFTEVPVLDLTGTPIPGIYHLVLKPLDQWSDDMRAAVKSIKHTKQGPSLEIHDKKGANDSLAKYFGMMVDKHELAGPGGTPLTMITSVMTPKEAAEAYAATLKHG